VQVKRFLSNVCPARRRTRMRPKNAPRPGGDVAMRIE